MEIVPVMDLLDGQVVRAVAGRRAHYRPIVSGIAATAEPLAVARALLGLAPFRRLYIADLDAITAGGSDRHVAVLGDICALAARCGIAELWLDAGGAPWLAGLAARAQAQGLRLVTVVGSESVSAGGSPAAPGWRREDPGWVLSLDYRDGRFLGPPELQGQAEAWPGRVIVMELAVVGSAAGPALERLAALREVALRAGRGDVAFYAAGGVRHDADLQLLAERGVAGALIASALHDGRLMKLPQR